MGIFGWGGNAKWGTLAGVFGGVPGMLVGNAIGKTYDKGGGKKTPSEPSQNDYSAAMVYASDNNKTVALAQIQAQEFAMQQASIDRQMQVAASLEMGLERLDTNLQVAKFDFFEKMTAEGNRHEEKMTQLFAPHSNHDGLPPPEAEEETG